MWSLGCIVYELVVGKPLFPAYDENELLEFLFITIGRVPDCMIEPAKK
jgi:serine/threonine protein kinase